MFYNEGNPVAVVVTNVAGRRRSSPMEFASAEAALGWCRTNGTMLVYCPANPSSN
jgi:hypothetical protein